MRHKARNFLPQQFVFPHNFTFLLHDILTELLRSGEEKNVFNTLIKLNNEEERVSFEQSENIFVWLETKGKVTERAELLRVLVFPALLSDMLHFIFEALDCSRKAKLNVTYALLRKPLQENLFILESIATDPLTFAELLVENPLALRATKLGGKGPHTQRINIVLEKLRIKDQFDADYIAQLRYEKCEDGFDGICNLAMHLFTGHQFILTEAMNINFIFSRREEKFLQWEFLYSRLPYLLAYTLVVVERVCEEIVATDPNYIEEMKLRIAAGTQLWWESVSDECRNEVLQRFVDVQGNWLRHYYESRGLELPATSRLEKLVREGRRNTLLSRLRLK